MDPMEVDPTISTPTTAPMEVVARIMPIIPMDPTDRIMTVKIEEDPMDRILK